MIKFYDDGLIPSVIRPDMGVQHVSGGRYVPTGEVATELCSLDAADKAAVTDECDGAGGISGSIFTMRFSGKDGDAYVCLLLADDNIVDEDDYDKLDFVIFTNTIEFNKELLEIEQFLINY
jgi:hypothetical protein